MNLRSLCPGFLFPYLQRLAALPDVARFWYYQKIIKDDPKAVLMVCPSRTALSGNCAYIAKALEGSEFSVDTLLEGSGISRKQALRKLAACRNIIVDDYTPFLYPLIFRKEAKVIQVWHSTGAFKRMGFARMGKRGSTVGSSLTHRNYTHVIVSAEGVVEDFEWAFGQPKEHIYPLGVPRTDLFFDEKLIEERKQALMSRYPQIENKKLILFAPTFRGDTRAKAHYPKEFLDIARLVEALPQDYILGLKLHPFIEEGIEIPPSVADRVIDLSSEREINDLLFCAHLLITDYSSVIFEYAFLNRPLIFYVPDLAEYDRDRSFFYDFETYTYGAVAKNQEELQAAILNPASFTLKKDAFFEKFLSACDGNSTARFVDTILREIDHS
ncbi:MAG: CDP-glycerol glycerophosphotransferase family protein [Clostridia bacterium]|nr:CDP-glycerol glycerophosphotransferase family protein [Clostridia bacterium]